MSGDPKSMSLSVRVAGLNGGRVEGGCDGRRSLRWLLGDEKRWEVEKEDRGNECPRELVLANSIEGKRNIQERCD